MKNQVRDMTQNYPFPEWISSDSNGLQKFLSDEAKSHLVEFRCEYDRFGSYIDQLPLEAATAEVYSLEIKDVLKIFPDHFSALLHVSEFLVARWYLTHACKLKSSFDGMHFALANGNFLLAVVCGRNIFEEVLHFSYFLKRLATKVKYLDEITKHEVNKLNKGRRIGVDFSEKTINKFFEMWTSLDKSVHGSDFDWKEFYEELADRYRSEDIRNEIKQIRAETPRKTHIGKLIEDFEKKTKVRASFYYSLFSEMVHPNGGSNKLVVSTRKKIDALRGDLIISATPKNPEAAAFFIECFGKILADVLHYAERDSKQAANLYQYFRDWAEQVAPPH
jgi:hypothetical protein